MHLDRTLIAAYLSEHYGSPVELIAVASLAAPTNTKASSADTADGLKRYGYGQPLLLRYCVEDTERQAVLRTILPSPFGHERRADRAAGMILSYDTFNTLPRHIRAQSLGLIAADGRLHGLPPGEEFFLLTDYAPGQPYAHDLERLRDTGELQASDLKRAHQLALYLADIHAEKRDEPTLYRRHLRDLFGSGEGIVGLLDSYPDDFALADAPWRESVERHCVGWRWRLLRERRQPAQIHGDFHPFNLLFDADGTFTLLDRSRGPWGEPADDVSCMAMNYLFFALQRDGMLLPPFSELWYSFWQTYLAHSGDEQLLRVVQPFLTWRALVLASPLWYNVTNDVRRILFAFVDAVLSERVFDPWLVTTYLKG
jgi:hypothetical protein